MAKVRIWSKEEESWLQENIEYDPQQGTFYNKVTKKQAPVGRKGNYIRITRYVGGRGFTYLGHRVAWFLYHGHQTKFFLDHINRNVQDNRIANLRECSYLQNNANRVPVKKGKLVGVKDVTMYKAVCNSEVIGIFNCKIDAAMAYDLRAKEVFGEFAYTNKEHGVY